MGIMPVGWRVVGWYIWYVSSVSSYTLLPFIWSVLEHIMYDMYRSFALTRLCQGYERVSR